MVLVALQPEVGGLDLFQPLGFVLAGQRVVRDALGEDQLRCGVGLALQLFAQHVDVILVDVRVADEIGEPARLVARQAADQVQQRGAFGEVEGGAEADVVRADVEAERDLALLAADQELVEEVAGRQRHLLELRPVPAVEEDAPAVGVLDDRVYALAQLIDRLVEQRLAARRLSRLVRELADQPVATRLCVGDLRRAVCIPQVDQLVGGPLAPLDAVDRTQVVFTQAVGVGQPLRVFVGVLVPDLAAQLAELGRAAVAAQEADQFADGGLEGELLGGDRRESLLQVELHHRAGDAARADAGAVVLPGAVLEDFLYEREILFHLSILPAAAAPPALQSSVGVSVAADVGSPASSRRTRKISR